MFRECVIRLLSDPDHRLRQSAAEILAKAGKDYVAMAVPQLLACSDDHRGYDSWPARITFAELLLNTEHCQEAIDTLLPALDYGTHPLAAVPNAENIRKQAALALGKLKAENRSRASPSASPGCYARIAASMCVMPPTMRCYLWFPLLKVSNKSLRIQGQPTTVVADDLQLSGVLLPRDDLRRLHRQRDHAQARKVDDLAGVVNIDSHKPAVCVEVQHDAAGHFARTYDAAQTWSICSKADSKWCGNCAGAIA